MDNDQQAQLQALLAQLQAAGTMPTATAQANAWAKPAVASAEVLGVSIPISIETPAGKLRAYLNFPGSYASSPNALLALIQQLSNAGLPLDTWQPKQQGGGNNRGGGGGGYNRGGGGYNSNRGDGWGG